MPTEYDIGAAFAAIEDELIASMIRNLKHHRAEETQEGFQWSQWQVEQLRALAQYRKDNLKKFDDKYFSAINRKIGNALQAAYNSGTMEQEAEILRAIKRGFPARKQKAALSGSFFRLNQRKLNALIQATTNDMEQAETAILRRASHKA